MINFLKSLFATKPQAEVAAPPQAEAAPQPTATDIPPGLLNRVEIQIIRNKIVATEEEKTVLDQLLRAVEHNDLASVARHFYTISQLSQDWHLENAGIMLSARINKMLKEKESGLIDAEKLKLERNNLIDALIRGLGNIVELLKNR